MHQGYSTPQHINRSFTKRVCFDDPTHSSAAGTVVAPALAAVAARRCCSSARSRCCSSGGPSARLCVCRHMCMCRRV